MVHRYYIYIYFLFFFYTCFWFINRAKIEQKIAKNFLDVRNEKNNICINLFIKCKKKKKGFCQKTHEDSRTHDIFFLFLINFHENLFLKPGNTKKF